MREVHGVSIDKIIIAEKGDTILVSAEHRAEITPTEARYLALKLHRLARRIEARTIARPLPTPPAGSMGSGEG